MKSKLLEHLDKIPPCICRLCGRKGGKAISTEELAARAGKSVSWVTRVGTMATWEKLSLANIILFSEACDVDLLHPRKKLYYLRRAFQKSGFRAISKGLPKGYVEKQIGIRQRYEKRMAKGKQPNNPGRAAT